MRSPAPGRAAFRHLEMPESGNPEVRNAARRNAGKRHFEMPDSGMRTIAESTSETTSESICRGTRKRGERGRGREQGRDGNRSRPAGLEGEKVGRRKVPGPRPCPATGSVRGPTPTRNVACKSVVGEGLRPSRSGVDVAFECSGRLPCLPGGVVGRGNGPTEGDRQGDGGRRMRRPYRRTGPKCGDTMPVPPFTASEESCPRIPNPL